MKITNLTWQTKPVTIKNNTTRTLSNGKVIPTWSAMLRQAAKIK
jgi:hypothetical protein